MKRTTMLTIALACAPVALCAQVSGQAQAAGSAAVKGRPAAVATDAQASASTEAQFRAPKGWTAEGSAKLEAMYSDARKKDLPPEPIARRVAEGSAKGSAESTILVSAGKVKANMESTQSAMAAAGRTKVSGEECERGALLMERGVTHAQIETMARQTPNDRSLVVAFDVLGRLAARGVPVTRAIAQVQAKLDAHASDAAIIALAGRAGSSTTRAAGTAASGTGVGATSSTTGAVAGTTKGVTVGAAGTVTGAIKKP